MKLAIISPGFKPVPAVKGGAIEQLITSIIKANERSHKFDIDLYTVYDSKIANYNFKYTKIISFSIKWYDFFLRIFSLCFRNICEIFHRETSFNYISFHIGKLYKRNYYDVVLIENNMDAYSAILKKINHEKIYFHLHNDFDNGDFAKTKQKVQKIIHTSDGLITVSNFLKRKLEKYGARNVNVVYNFVPGKFSNLLNNTEQLAKREKFNIANNDVVFSYIGRLDKEKGADKFLMALEKTKCHNEKIKGLVIGNSFFNSKEEKIFYNKINTLKRKLKSKAKFLGYISNDRLTDIYAISDCIVIPSQVEEAFGLVALEAMKMKKPVIASNSGALPEILSAEGSIIIDKEHNFVNALAETMENIAQDPNMRKKMGDFNFNKSKTFPQNDNEYFSLITRIIKKCE